MSDSNYVIYGNIYKELDDILYGEIFAHCKEIRSLLPECGIYETPTLCAVIDYIITGNNINMTDDYRGTVTKLTPYYNREDHDHDTK